MRESDIAIGMKVRVRTTGEQGTIKELCWSRDNCVHIYVHAGAPAACFPISALEICAIPESEEG